MVIEHLHCSEREHAAKMDGQNKYRAGRAIEDKLLHLPFGALLLEILLGRVQMNRPGVEIGRRRRRSRLILLQSLRQPTNPINPSSTTRTTASPGAGAGAGPTARTAAGCSPTG